MAVGLSLQTRRAVLEQMASAYREAPLAKKRVLLAEFTQTTGYHRTYARWLLNHREEVLQTVARHPRQPRYGPEVVDALVQAWNANNRKCTKCLIPFLPTLLDSFAAVFAALPAGEYVTWSDPAETFTIVGGGIAELNWRDADIYVPPVSSTDREGRGSAQRISSSSTLSSILPPRYQGGKQVSSAPMGTAPLQYTENGQVAWMRCGQVFVILHWREDLPIVIPC